MTSRRQPAIPGRVLRTAVAALGVALSALSAAPAAHAAPDLRTARAAHVAPRGPVQDSTFPRDFPRAVSASSPTDAWAAGDQCVPSCSRPSTLLLHWNGTNWAAVKSPDPSPKGNALGGVAAISRTDAWAVGFTGSSGCASAATLIVHWNGAAWSRVTSPDPGAACDYLNGISAVSASDIWAVGESCTFTLNHCHTAILHWDGTSWSAVASPTPGAGKLALLYRVSADSATDAWAVGQYCPTTSCPVMKTLTLHWNGTSWSTVKSPNPRSGSYNLLGVSAASPAAAWAVGYYCPASTCSVKKTLILRWDGTSWSKAASPDPGLSVNGLSDVTALSATSAWAVGDSCAPGSCTAHDTLILHWDGTTWSQVTSPDPVTKNYLAGVGGSSASDIWAVGSTETAAAENGAMILHWNGTAWSTSVS